MNTFVRIVDKINEIVGNLICWLIVVMMIIQVIESTMRYVFNNPTSWGWEVNQQVFMAMVLLSAGFVLLKKGHVRLDILYSRVSPRAKLILDMVLFPLAMLFLIVLVWQAGDMAATAWHYHERSSSSFAPPVYPIKTVLVVGSALLLLQTVADFFRNIIELRNMPKSAGAELKGKMVKEA